MWLSKQKYLIWKIPKIESDAVISILLRYIFYGVFYFMNRKESVMLVYIFILYKFSDRKIVHGVLVTKSVAKRHDGTESPLVISGWIFFYYCFRGEHVAVGFLWKQECLFSFLDSSSVWDSDPQDFLGHPDPDPDLLVRDTDPDPAPDPSLFS
jgi:hypothetical protein